MLSKDFKVLFIFLSIIQQSFILQICLFYTFFIQNAYADKKYPRQKAKQLCLMGQIVIESHSFLEHGQNR